jgi:hypothetical protein
MKIIISRSKNYPNLVGTTKNENKKRLGYKGSSIRAKVFGFRFFD